MNVSYEEDSNWTLDTVIFADVVHVGRKYRVLQTIFFYLRCSSAATRIGKNLTLDCFFRNKKTEKKK
jgi:hypothetical protein